MARSWQNVLGDLIVGYFSDRDRETGLREAAMMAVAHERLYRAYVGALEAGIASAARGERDAIDAVSPIKRFKDPAEAKVYLETVLARFLELCDELAKDKVARPWPRGDGGA